MKATQSINTIDFIISFTITLVSILIYFSSANVAGFGYHEEGLVTAIISFFFPIIQFLSNLIFQLVFTNKFVGKKRKVFTFSLIRFTDIIWSCIYLQTNENLFFKSLLFSLIAINILVMILYGVFLNLYSVNYKREWHIVNREKLNKYLHQLLYVLLLVTVAFIIGVYFVFRR